MEAKTESSWGIVLPPSFISDLGSLGWKFNAREGGIFKYHLSYAIKVVHNL